MIQTDVIMYCCWWYIYLHLSTFIYLILLTVGNVLSGAVLQSDEGRVGSHQTYTKVPLCQICCLLFILVSEVYAFKPLYHHSCSLSCLKSRGFQLVGLPGKFRWRSSLIHTCTCYMSEALSKFLMLVYMYILIYSNAFLLCVSRASKFDEVILYSGTIIIFIMLKF